MSANNIAISVHNLSKCYRIGTREKTRESIGSSIINFLKSPLDNYRKYKSLYDFSDAETNTTNDILWALRDVSFDVKKGEVLGIIGKNGAGKSTLLKILSRITDPTTGKALVRGRMSSLLEVGTGFHQELTGRENIYLNGAILGMTKKEINKKLDDIIDFSGIHKYVDTPVKRYSSGMRMRLAFSVAAHLDPEILVIDEVLPVGDSEFQKKCLGKMQDISGEGRTVLFVSHNMGAILDLCKNAIILEKGKMKAAGKTADIVDMYLESQFSEAEQGNLLKADNRKGDGRLRFRSLKILKEDGAETKTPISGRPLKARIEYECTEDIQNLNFELSIFNQMGAPAAHCSMESLGKRFNLKKGIGHVTCRIERLPLPLGNYKISLAATDNKGILDWVPTASTFDIQASCFFGTAEIPPMQMSAVLLDQKWTPPTNTQQTENNKKTSCTTNTFEFAAG